MEAGSELEYPAYVGVWTNWSRGSVFGATLTLERAAGNLVIAFLAFYVAWIGTHSWKIMCLVLHFTYSSPDPQDGLHHQRQAILSNSANPEGSLFKVIQLAWAWRKNAARPYVRLLLLGSVCLSFVTGFTVASGFSSRVSSAIGTEVLLYGGNCAIKNHTAYDETNRTDISTFYAPYRAKLLENWENYAEQCYETKNSSRLFGCGTFIKKRLPSTTITNTSCPFGNNICLSPDQNLRFDTGYLDSHYDFGINAPAQQRFQFRRVTECAVLKSEGYTTQVNISSAVAGNWPYTRWHYGGAATSTGWLNHTYQHINDAFRVVHLRTPPGVLPAPDFELAVMPIIWSGGKMIERQSYFDPIPELRTPDADFVLLFLSSGRVAYSAPNNDPWYKATTLAGRFLGKDTNGTIVTVSSAYVQDQAASPLACKTSSQLCNPNLPQGSRCGPLTNSEDFLAGAATVFPGLDKLSGRLPWLYTAAFGTEGHIADLLWDHGTAALVSRRGMASSTIGQLPDNQWVLDIQHWTNTGLASLQGALVAAALGPYDSAGTRWYNRGPNSTEELDLCRNQKISSTAYLSFSLFGLLFILFLGIIIIFISFTLDTVMSQLRKRYGIKRYQQLEWQSNDALQLQRLAHEEAGAGTWSGGAEPVPLTQIGETLALLDISNPEHPKLRILSEKATETSGKQGLVVLTAEVRRSNDRTDISPTNTTSITPTSTIAASPSTPDAPHLTLAETDVDNRQDPMAITPIDSDRNTAEVIAASVGETGDVESPARGVV